MHAKGGKNEFATVILQAHRFEDLPRVHRIGDIIRVHRATLRLYKGTRQFNVPMYFNASWALFSGDKKSILEEMGQGDAEEKGADKEYSSFNHSGKKVELRKVERDALNKIKTWGKNYLSSNDGVTKDMYDSLNCKKKSDYDALVKILHVQEKDEYTNELKLRDASGTVAYCQTLKMKFPHLKSGDVARIRSCETDETASSRKVINLAHYSNIMTFVSYSKAANHIRSSVKDDKSVEKAALKGGMMMQPVVLTEVTGAGAKLPFTTLHDLFHNESDPEIANNTTFRTQFYVSKIEPGDVKEWCKSYDKKTKKSASFKGAKAAGGACYQVQFLCKDITTQYNANYYRILLYSHDGLGANFFGVNADNLYKNDGARKKLEEAAKNLTKFNSWVDAVVEKRNGYYCIKDTKMVL